MAKLISIFTIVNYDSSVVIWGKRKMFIRLATAQIVCRVLKMVNVDSPDTPIVQSPNNEEKTRLHFDIFIPAEVICCTTRLEFLNWI